MVGPVPLYTTSLQRNTSRLRSNSEVATGEDAWLIRHAEHQCETRDVIDWFSGDPSTMPTNVPVRRLQLIVRATPY